MTKYLINVLFLSTIVLLLMQSSVYSQNTYDLIIRQAAASANKNDYLNAAKAYSIAFGSNDNKGKADDRYEAARCWALAGKKDSAFCELQILAKSYFGEYLKLSTDTAFIPLREDGRWPEILRAFRFGRQKIIELENLKYKNIDKSLVALLEGIYVDDQFYRLQLDYEEKNHGISSYQSQKIMRLINDHDLINLFKIDSIVNKYGWPRKDVVGQEGSETMFLVIQHANLKAQLKYFPMLKNATVRGDVRQQDMAILQDRISIRLGKKQEFGSQIGLNDKTGKYYVLPLMDPKNVNRRRAKVGLGPIEQYLSQWQIKWNLTNYSAKMN